MLPNDVDWNLKWKVSNIISKLIPVTPMRDIVVKRLLFERWRLDIFNRHVKWNQITCTYQYSSYIYDHMYRGSSLMDNKNWTCRTEISDIQMEKEILRDLQKRSDVTWRVTNRNSSRRVKEICFVWCYSKTSASSSLPCNGKEYVSYNVSVSTLYEISIWFLVLSSDFLICFSLKLIVMKELKVENTFQAKRLANLLWSSPSMSRLINVITSTDLY